MRGLLGNIPNIDAFIMKRKAVYFGKVTRPDQDFLPRKFLAAWINRSQKNGAPQLTCNNNFSEAIDKILLLDKLSQAKLHRLENSSSKLKKKVVGKLILTTTLRCTAKLNPVKNLTLIAKAKENDHM